MRVLNSLRNTTAGMLQMIITMLIGFVARAIFIQTLGIEYQGLNSLFTSIISMLSIAELGLGTAIIYSMYRYIAESDTEMIKSLMRFYKICYRVIAGIVFIVGICILPFIHLFAEYDTIHESIYLIYLLFLSDAVFSYLFSYKRSILYAQQKNYIVNLMDLAYTIALNTVQIVILLATENFILFLLVKVVFRLVENGIINLIANRKYPYITDKNAKKLDDSILKGITLQIKGLIFHKLGSVVVFGIDSMIITRFLGLVTMGMYSNYTMIVNAVSSVFSQVVRGAVASVGNLLTEKNPDKSFDIYKKLSFMSFWIYAFAAISIYMMMEPFITLWIGGEFLLSRYILLFVCLNFYLQGMRNPISMFKDAAGIFYEDRYVPVIEALTNFLLSLLLVNMFGIVGILLGTIVSTMILFVYSFPKYVYVPLFKKKASIYLKEQIYYLMLLGVAFACTVGVARLFASNNEWGNFIVNLIISLTVPNILFCIIFNRKDEFKYFKELFFRLVLRKQ